MKKTVITISAIAAVVVVIAIAAFIFMTKDIGAARQIAQEKVNDSNAKIVEEKTEKEFLVTEYEFSLVSDTYRYEVKVDSFGNITGFEKEEIPSLPAASSNASPSANTSTPSNGQSNSTQPSNAQVSNTSGSTADIGMNKAQEIAKAAHANGVITQAERDMDYNKFVYEIEVTEGNIEYDYVIDAETGNIIHTKKDFRD